ncbi:MAG: TonB-dependent receptor plug domain-containing protein [Gemmatimonadetes bacterium]|nr:TonB-dependent receptor plug domain-containing protein [Gemmatimonadota bacterium]
MRYPLLLLLGVLSLAGGAGALQAQILAGTLLEAEGKTPLAGGAVMLLDRDSAVVELVHTDSAGEFSFTVPRRAAYRLRAEALGYRPGISPPLTINMLDTLSVEFSLAREAVVLEPLVVKARNRRITSAARRFYNRAEDGGFGTFITRDQIEKVHPVNTTDLFNRIPGVSTAPMMGGNSVMVRGNCRPTLFVDGVRINGYRSIDDLARPRELEGVEVYRSAHQAPVEFTGLRAGCAVVLLWTRIE